MNIDITGTMRGYAGGGQGGTHDQLDPTLQHMGHGGKAAHDYATSGFVGSSGVVITRYNNTKCGTRKSCPKPLAHVIPCCILTVLIFFTSNHSIFLYFGIN